MSIADRYTFEAEMPDGRIVTEGGDLTGAVRVSLIPGPDTGLPRHDLVGQPFKHRFMRHFKRSTVGGFDRRAYFAQVEANLGDARKAARQARNEKGVSVTLDDVPPPPPRKLDECVQVIVMEHSRLYVRHADGTALLSPPDYELYL